jgi:hypothetical protein
MVTMGIFSFKEISEWWNWESNPAPDNQQSETLDQTMRLVKHDYS